MYIHTYRHKCVCTILCRREREREGVGGSSNPDVYHKTPSSHNVIQVSACFGGGGEGEGRGRGCKEIGDVFRSST